MEHNRVIIVGTIPYNKNTSSRAFDADRKSVVQGKSVDLGGRRIIKKIFFKQKTAYEM